MLWSHSKISCFEQCPLKFRFRYIDKLPVPEGAASVEAFLGKRVHEALEKLYKDLQFGRSPSLDELLSFYNLGWRESWSEDVVIVSKEYGAEDYRRKGELFVTDYYLAHKPFTAEGKTVGLEMKVLLPLQGKENLVGYVDRLSYLGAGRYEIHDYKTSSRLPSAAHIEGDRQLALYAAAIRLQFPDARKVELIWHYLAFNKDLRSSRTAAQLEKLVGDTSSEIERINAEKEFSAKEGALCPYCEFQESCPKRAHLFKVGRMPENEYMKEPGVVLVDKLAELKDKKRKEDAKLDEELAKVEEALLAFAIENKVDNVAGSTHMAKIKTEQVVSFPPKGEREGLVKVLKKEGVWDDVSDLDVFALKRMIKEGKIDEGKLEKFETVGTQRRISLSKLKS